MASADLVGSTSNENTTAAVNTTPQAHKVSTRSSRSNHPPHHAAKDDSVTEAASSRVRRSNRRRNTTTVVNTSSTVPARSSRLRPPRGAAVKPVSTTGSCPVMPTQSTAGGLLSRATPIVPSTNSSTNSAAAGGTVVLRQFEAHKAILAARSPVFAAMFEHGMEESRANRVEITDMEPDTLAEVLRYIYTGHVVGLDKLAHDLLAAADKYQLERLKIMCEEALVESLTADNCCDILVLADLHNAEQLKTHTLEFIMLHAHDVCETEGYEQLVLHRPRLLTECFRSLAAQQLPLRCSARKRPRQS